MTFVAPAWSDQVGSTAELARPHAEHLRRLIASWQVLADLSFSDLLLYVKVAGEESFEICAQLRPFTSQTLYPNDMVGVRVGQPEQPVVERAFREGRIWRQQDPVLVDGVPIRMDAVPVRCDGEVIAVVSKEGSPATSRRPGLLERVYLDAAERVSAMVCEGSFPWRDAPVEEWPRVGDGLVVLDASGRVTWASPNALSSLRRLGVTHVVIGSWLDDLGLGPTPVGEALDRLRVLDGELARGGTDVVLRVMPLLEKDRAVGALVLSRDVSEVRQKERLLSVKDATIREIHHRVKNNLQTIASLLRLQGRRLDSPEAKAALQESVLRIGSIALVHETLSQELRDVVHFEHVARRICGMVADGLIPSGAGIGITVTGSTGTLSSDVATPLAVALTELLQNAVEHAYPNGGSGAVVVELDRVGDDVVVEVCDDGVGMPPEPSRGARLGLQIVRTLIDELGGRFEVNSGPGGGTRVVLLVPGG
jgi:two-component system, sensor histidine kinase PdtaS